MDPAHVLVLDIGKTNAKAVLVDSATLTEIDVLSCPNRPLPGPPYPHADTDGLWQFILASAGTLHRRHRVDALVTTTHAATAALIDAGGALALPVLDYEHAGPNEVAADYDALRPDFRETGSPRLPDGLNLGAQVFWQSRRFPEAFARAKHLMLYPQYWAHRLCGVAATEATSLGSHTDLWDPQRRCPSSLVDAEGWRPLLPPLRRASDRLGPVRSSVAAATGLDPATPVHCGIHDSNASLLPHLAARRPPFAVVSTGTWVVAMAVGGRASPLDPARDTLVNVDAFGDPVPSARFMGGREWSRLIGARSAATGPREINEVLAHGIRLHPSVATGSGPFPGRAAAWSVPEATLTDGARAVAASWYLALMTEVCLELIGAAGPVCVEGPLVANADFIAMLGAATGSPIIPAGGTATGTSAGAAMLALSDLPAASPAAPVAAPATDRLQALRAYRARWRADLGVVSQDGPAPRPAGPRGR